VYSIIDNAAREKAIEAVLFRIFPKKIQHNRRNTEALIVENILGLNFSELKEKLTAEIDGRLVHEIHSREVKLVQREGDKCILFVSYDKENIIAVYDSGGIAIIGVDFDDCKWEFGFSCAILNSQEILSYVFSTEIAQRYFDLKELDRQKYDAMIRVEREKMDYAKYQELKKKFGE
jgi:hypothetical protein